MAMAGTSAMNGEPISATTAMRKMAARHPASARTTRTPSAIRLPMLSESGLDTCPGSRRRSRATTTAPKEAAFKAKAHVAEPSTSTEPGQGGADHPSQVELGRRQRHRGEQVTAGHEVGQHRLIRGKAHRGGQPPTKRQADELERMGVAGGRQHRQHRGAPCFGQRRDDEPAATVEAVGERAADRGEQADGDECGRRHQSRPQAAGGSGR